MDALIASCLVVAGAILGAALAWMMSRARNAAQIDAQVARADAERRAEAAALDERLRQSRAELERRHKAFDELKAHAERWRDELVLVRDERAKLAERASRLATLDQQAARLAQQLDDRSRELADLRESAGRINSQLQAELAAERDAHAATRSDLAGERGARQLAETELTGLRTEHARLRTQFAAEQQQAADKTALLMSAKEELTNQFKALANDILEEKSRRFAEQNQLNLGQLLDPLRSKIAEFQTKVEDVYVKEGHARTALSEQVRQLVELNQALGQDARNLANALKGSAKTQGNWGELILERVLESAGLQKGQFYQVQDSQLREDGSRGQPDVVINLPGERRLVVDAKASLVAYERYVAADDDPQRAVAVRQHLDSVRAHVKGLSDKNYHELYKLKSLDFVVMFVPIEPAFMLAVTHDEALFMDAWRRNVLLVSPSTLLFVVRTVAYLWTQEAQSRNAQDIAKRGAELYDKLVGFVTDLQTVGTRIKQAGDSYDDAFRKIASGRGNLVWQAEALKKLGVKPNKALPTPLVDAALGSGSGASAADDESCASDDILSDRRPDPARPAIRELPEI